MAVYAAHLTRTLQGTPSIFQVTAQGALGATVKPALRKVIEYLAAVYPNKFNWSVQWYDELYLVFDFCLQYHYIKHYAASFSETFYGLLRVPISASNEFSSGQRLPEYLERWSLVILVLVPYLRDKTEQLIETWREADEDGKLGKCKSDRAKKAAVRLYAILHIVCEGAKLVQLSRYVRGNAGAHSPALALLGLMLRDAPPRCHDQYSWRDFWRSALTGDIASVGVSSGMLGAALLRAVEYGAFAVQFLRWWGEGGPARPAPLPVPPPPPAHRGVRGRMNVCGVCGSRWSVPTAIPVSGAVLCYSCAVSALRATRACPLTGLPASPDDLIRLYLDD